MVRRRSTVRFRNGAQVDGLIRKDSNGSWMPVGTNGCHQGAESLATASPERRYPQGIRGYPEPTVRSRIPCRPADQDAGRARVGTGTGACQTAGRLGWPRWQILGRAPGTATGWSGAGQWGARDHFSGPGAADRLALDPGQPGGTRAARAPGAGVGSVRSVPGAGEIDAVLSWAIQCASQLGRLRALRAWRRSAGTGVGSGDGLPSGLDLDGAAASDGLDEFLIDPPVCASIGLVAARAAQTMVRRVTTNLACGGRPDLGHDSGVTDGAAR